MTKYGDGFDLTATILLSQVDSVHVAQKMCQTHVDATDLSLENSPAVVMGSVLEVSYQTYTTILFTSVVAE